MTRSEIQSRVHVAANRGIDAVLGVAYTPHMMGRRIEDPEREFWNRVRKQESVTSPHVSTPCWIYLCSTETVVGGRKYGWFSYPRDGVKNVAHRYAHFLAHGPVPENLSVLHHCDNTRCVRDEHLFLGTPSDNIRDAISKHRFVAAREELHGTKTHPESVARGDRNGSRTHPERLMRGDRHTSRTRPEVLCRGTDNRHAKLDDDKVHRMRRLYVELGMGARALSRMFGVSISVAQAVIHHKSWKHVL